MSARKLMKILVTGGCLPDEPVANAQVESWAVASGLEGTELVDALTEASANGWITLPNPGFIAVTKLGNDSGNA